ncbi:MAG: recombinase family protein [Pseudorhodoplanes sp.]
MRTLIYARYSSTLQNPRSIEDQLAACRARAEAEGWSIVGEFSDRAISGAAGIDESQRPGLAQQYRAAVQQLHRELADEETRKEAAPQLRRLIARIVVTPSAGRRGVEIEVIRHLDEVLALAERRSA